MYERVFVIEMVLLHFMRKDEFDERRDSKPSVLPRRARPDLAVPSAGRSSFSFHLRRQLFPGAVSGKNLCEIQRRLRIVAFPRPGRPGGDRTFPFHPDAPRCRWCSRAHGVPKKFFFGPARDRHPYFPHARPADHERPFGRRRSSAAFSISWSKNVYVDGLDEPAQRDQFRAVSGPSGLCAAAHLFCFAAVGTVFPICAAAACQMISPSVMLPAFLPFCAVWVFVDLLPLV